MVKFRYYVAYVVKFLLVFSIFNFGAKAFFSITVPDGPHYVAWFDNNINFIGAYRRFLFNAAQLLLGLMGYTTVIENNYILRIVHSNGVRMVWSCLGIGLLSFWAAFVVANPGKVWLKAKWWILGWAIITISNIFRIAILLVAFHEKWPSPLNLGHHDFYNYCIYLILTIVIIAYWRESNRMLN